MVILEDVCFQPLHAPQAPREWNLHCPQSGIVMIIGDNGSGKSTLAQLLAGWFPDFLPGALRGAGVLPGGPIGQMPLVERAQYVQLVQQSPWLQFSGCTFSVEEEIAFGPENLCLPPETILQRIEQAMTITDSLSLRYRHPVNLSGGEAQRVTIASALAMRPQLLLLDEALSRLSPPARHRMLSQLAEWARSMQALVILFERDPTPVQAWCQSGWRLTTNSLEPLC